MIMRMGLLGYAGVCAWAVVVAHIAAASANSARFRMELHCIVFSWCDFAALRSCCGRKYSGNAAPNHAG